MRKKKKSRLEEYHTGKTMDLRNVVAEIQKVDQETSDLSAVVQEAQRIDRRKRSDPNGYTCRLLFATAMDKVYLFFLFLGFAILSYLNFKGNIFGASYGYWIRFLREIGLLVLFFILSLFCNWFYKCAIKTMLCVTNHSVTVEKYFPLWKREISIPIQHITSVSTFSFFWVIRGVILHQYSRFPLVFFTWNHLMVKSKIDELLHNDSIDYNGASHKTIFKRRYYSLFRWGFLLLSFVVIVLGIAHFFGYILSPERTIAGTYIKGNQKMELQVNGNCSLRLLSIKKLKNCHWKYETEEHTIRIQYEFSKKDYYGKYYDKKDIITVGYKEDVLIYNGIEYKKK